MAVYLMTTSPLNTTCLSWALVLMGIFGGLVMWFSSMQGHRLFRAANVAATIAAIAMALSTVIIVFDCGDLWTWICYML